MAWNFDEKPLLVFWETTRACDLACRHCRASAISAPLPGQLSGAEGRALIDQVAGFGRPSPILILTGGDVLKRTDLFDLIAYAREKRIPVSVSPSVTPLLNETMIDRLADAGIAAMSLSLDDATSDLHDGLRGVPGTWARTLELGRYAVSRDIRLQINSTVMRTNVERLPALFELIHGMGADIWEVFFLIQTGRGKELLEADPATNEAVCHFLYKSSFYGVTVRTVEGPFYRRVVAQYEDGTVASPEPLAQRLIADLEARLGPASHRTRSKSAGTRDGKGIVFISHKGDVSPSGFLPVSAGNVREQPLGDIYQRSPLFTDLRAVGRFGGECGRCEWKDLCGGSRARAHATSGDPLGEDPACLYTVARVG
jgi:radical SAM protein